MAGNQRKPASRKGVSSYQRGIGNCAELIALNVSAISLPRSTKTDVRTEFTNGTKSAVQRNPVSNRNAFKGLN